MAEKWFDNDKIKLAMKKASSSPIPFAFGIGGSPAEGKLAMHPKREPAFLLRALKKEGYKASRILVGTAETDGSTLIVTCEKEVPKAKKSIRFFLRENQFRQKKVRLMGPNGEFGLEDDDDEEGTAAEGAVRTRGGEEAGDQGPQDSAADPRLAELKAVAGELAASIGTISDAKTKGKLAAALKGVIALIGRGDADAAESTLAKLQTVLARVGPAEDEDQAASKSASQWAAFSAKIEPQVLAALKTDHPDAGKIRAVWGFAQEKGEAGDMESAKKAVARLVPMLKAAAATAADAPAANDEDTAAGAKKSKIAPGVAFTQSRLAWNGARQKIQAELRSLEQAIIDAAKDEDPEIFGEIKGKTAVLYDILGQRDEALMDKLDEGLNAEKDSPAQLKAYAEASKMVKDYVSYVNGSPLVQEIDSNPFKPVAVKKTLDQTLKVLASRLAA